VTGLGVFLADLDGRDGGPCLDAGTSPRRQGAHQWRSECRGAAMTIGKQHLDFRGPLDPGSFCCLPYMANPRLCRLPSNWPILARILKPGASCPGFSGIPTISPHLPGPFCGSMTRRRSPMVWRKVIVRHLRKPSTGYSSSAHPLPDSRKYPDPRLRPHRPSQVLRRPQRESWT